MTIWSIFLFLVTFPLFLCNTHKNSGVISVRQATTYVRFCATYEKHLEISKKSL